MTLETFTVLYAIGGVFVSADFAYDMGRDPEADAERWITNVLCVAVAAIWPILAVVKTTASVLEARRRSR